MFRPLLSPFASIRGGRDATEEAKACATFSDGGVRGGGDRGGVEPDAVGARRGGTSGGSMELAIGALVVVVLVIILLRLLGLF